MKRRGIEERVVFSISLFFFLLVNVIKIALMSVFKCEKK
jgi:hypothetical protein